MYGDACLKNSTNPFDDDEDEDEDDVTWTPFDCARSLESAPSPRNTARIATSRARILILIRYAPPSGARTRDDARSGVARRSCDAPDALKRDVAPATRDMARRRNRVAQCSAVSTLRDVWW
jgi:hypothetical protein